MVKVLVIYTANKLRPLLDMTPYVVTPSPSCPMLTAYLQCLKLVVVLVGRTNACGIGCNL